MPATRNTIAAIFVAAVSAEKYSGNGPSVKDGDNKTVMDTSFSYEFSSGDTWVATTQYTKVALASGVNAEEGNLLETCVKAFDSGNTYSCFQNSWYDGEY
jgi:hypothetical protein